MLARNNVVLHIQILAASLISAKMNTLCDLSPPFAPLFVVG